MLDSDRKLLETPANSSDHKGKHGRTDGAWKPMDFDSTTKSRPALNYDIFRSWNGRKVPLREEEMASGLRLSPERSPQFYRSNYHSLSPSSKAQAIETGQKELMELASQMPESCYELSLRDLVEQPMVLGRQEEAITDEREFNLISDREFLTKESSKKKKEIRAPMSIENGGFYLKLGFPRSLATTEKKKKKKNDSVLNTTAKVSPSADKEWWKKRFAVSSESESLDSSLSSGRAKSSSSSSSHCSNDNRRTATTRRASISCWSWFFLKHNDRNE